MLGGTTLEEAVVVGAREQWRNDSSWTLGTITTIGPTTPMYLGDLTEEILAPLAYESRETSRSINSRLRTHTTYEKVPIAQAKDGGRQVLGLRWVDVTKAEGSHRGGLVAKTLTNFKAPKLVVATPPIETRSTSNRRARRTGRRA